MKTLLIVALIVTGALAMGQGNMMPTYSDFDIDGNGKVTQEEFENTQQARMSAQSEAGRIMRNADNAPIFSDIDTNSDGNIDEKEFQTHQIKNRKNMRRGQGRNQ
jgi:Ca2+-binding EF-hand superfamily protein